MRKCFLNYKLYSYLSLVLILTTMPLRVLAIDVDFYSANDILFYSPDETDGCSTVNISSDAANIQKSEALQQISQLLINGGMNAGQTAAIMGNMYAESGFNSDVHEVGNDIGYGLAQWSFGRRTQLENYATQKNIVKSDIALQIEFLLSEYNNSYKARLDNTDFKNGTDIAKSTQAWMEIFEAPLASPANDPAALNSKRIPAAQRIYELYGSTTTGFTFTTNGCNGSGNGIIAGGIVNTAINLALPIPAAIGMINKSDASKAYQTAKEQYNPDGEWSDCGRFVATVMIASGADPNYVKVMVDQQLAYVKAHPEKYIIINKPTASDLQPGDILIASRDTTQHTTIYTGNNVYNNVAASLNDFVPSAQGSYSHIWMIDNGAIIARLIK